jgi:phosphoribosyl 1,2-cyclic phosphodiesterase
MSEPQFLVRIWGARGSLPAPAANNTVFGSDTCSVEMRCGGHVLIFDVGSGAESLSSRLTREAVRDFDIFFSHCHFDHIMGLPFLKPLYDHEVIARIYAGHFEDDTTCRQMADGFMAPPYFPVTPKYFDANISYIDFRPPETLKPHPGIVIETMRLNHPNGCVAYRVNYSGKSVCYMTDIEHVPGQHNDKLVAFLRGTDILIYDCTYTDSEFSHYRGYGHSTWQEGVRICEAAGIRQLVIFHHRPGRDDNELRKMESEAKARFSGAIMGATGLELVL